MSASPEDIERDRIRHSLDHPCPICGGHESLPRGTGTRCHGYSIQDGGVLCSQIESDKPNDNGCFWHPHPTRVTPPTPGSQASGPLPWVDEDWDAIHSYLDEERRLLFQVLRRGSGENKQIRQRAPDPSARFGLKFKLTGVRRVPYRLPELLAALEAGAAQLIIAEGEKAVHALEGAGLLATTTPQGAKSWKKCSHEAIPVFARFPEITVFRDNDAVGLAFARKIMRDLAKAGHNRVRLVRSRTDGAGDDAVDHFASGFSFSEVIEESSAGEVPEEDSESAADPSDPRPEILHRDGWFEESVDRGEAALVQVGAEIYQRGGKLVRVSRIPTPSLAQIATIPAGTPTIQILPVEALREKLNRAAQWVVLTKDGPRRKACPALVSKTLYERGEWHFPVLESVIEAPALRSDGSLISEPGLDSRTGLLYLPGDSFPAIPEHPSRDEALRELGEIARLLGDFNFVAAHHRSAALAMILTGLVRRSLPTAPMFSISAPVMGSGKTLLAKVSSIIATGREPALLSQGRDEAEDMKRLFSILLAGVSVVVIDNVERPLGGGHLCAVLTTRTYNDRVLGKSMVVEVPTSVLLIATGNNIQVSGDLSRRVVPIMIDPVCERPDARDGFAIPDLLEHVRRTRAQLVSAGLTVLRAYYAAGRPHVVSRLGSFEEWSDLVRSALIWLGEPDPMLGRESVEQADPRREVLGAVLEAWFAAFGSDPKRAAQVIEATDGGDMFEINLGLRSALDSIVTLTDGAKLTSKSLGVWIATHKGRVQNGLRFSHAGTYQGTKAWRVEQVGPR